MKSILLTAVIVGAAAALIIYVADQSNRAPLKGSNDVGGAAEDAYDTMNAHLGHLERETEKAFDDMLR